MSQTRADFVLHHLRRLTSPASNGPLSDGDLVARFGSSRDEAAFAELVRRHGPMVLGVCRGILRHVQDAEDAFQAAFLVLARKSGSVRRGDAVGSWLFRVAHRVALRARTAALRQPALIPEAEPLTVADPLGDLTVRELQQALYEELARLPEKYRAPLVCCYLEGQTQDEAARRLGWSKGAVRGRLNRGRERLRARLTARGLGVALGLTTAVAVPLPAALAAATIRAGVPFAAGPPTAAGATRAVVLAGGVLRAMLATKLKAGAALLSSLALLAVGAGFAAHHAQNAEQPRVSSEADAAGVAEAPQSAVTVQGRVIDKESGAGLKGVEVWLYYLVRERELIGAGAATTDADGRYSAEVKPQVVLARVQQAPASYLLPYDGSDLGRVDAAKKREMPVIALQRAVRLDGIVVDKAGKPVAGATVQVVQPPQTGRRPDRQPAVSDAEGKVTLTGLDPTDTVPLWARTEEATTNGAVVATPADVKGPVRLIVAKENACRLYGRVVNEAGRPVADAGINVQWHYRYVSKRTSLTGSSAVVQRLRTDAEGRFETGALWPGDSYRAEVSANGYARAESIRVTGRPGQVHDVGRIILIPTSGIVRGRVLDSAGQPVAGVRVFNTGDAPKTVAMQTDAQGQFRLDELYAGPVFLFAEEDGYRFTKLRVETGGAEVAVQLLKREEAPPRVPPADRVPSFAEQQRIARRLLERLWALPPEPRAAGLRSLLGSMARLDPDQALQWAVQAGGRYANAVRCTAAESLAQTDPDRALALLAPVTGDSAYYPLLNMVERCLTVDRAMALRYVEAAVPRARKRQQPALTWSLAEVGSLLRQLGQEEAGRKLIDEAAILAEKLGTEGHQALARGLVADALAPYDEKRGRSLIEPIKGPQDRLRFFMNFFVARGVPEPNLPPRGVLRLAYALARTAPQEAIRLVDGIRNDAKIKAEAYGWLAVAVAPRDKQLAWSLIDRSLAQYRENLQTFRSWSNYGGASTLAARVAGQAREVGYPDLDSVVARVLALRTAGNDDTPARVTESHAATALVLALTDPPTARQLLESLEPRSQLIGSGYSDVRRPHWFQAWALADPGEAVALFDRELKTVLADPKADLARSGLFDLVEILTIPPAERPRHLLCHWGAFWFPGEE